MKIICLACFGGNGSALRQLETAEFPRLAAQFHEVLLWFVFADTLVQEWAGPCPLPRAMQYIGCLMFSGLLDCKWDVDAA